MSTTLFSGCGVALITPFTDNGLNLDALDALVDFQIANGVNALFAVGTTGEPSTMTEAERDTVIERIVTRVNGRVPVIAGTGGNNTAEIIRAAQRAKSLGADAQLCVTPYYNKTTQQGLVAHYTAIAEDGSLPVYVYNVPHRTGLNMLPETLAELAEHDMIIAMKEASGDIAQCAKMVRLCGDRIAFYTGNDDQTLATMALGFRGVISVAGNIIPQQMGDIVRLFLAGKVKEARELQYALDPLIEALFTETSPIPVKTAAAMMGFDAGPLRLPLCPPTKAHTAQLQQEMCRLGLISEANKCV